MDPKTFEALKAIMETFEEQIGHRLEEEVELVLAWMDEVEKEIGE